MEKHIHKYVRIKIGKHKRVEFKCSLLGCLHHIREEFALGRQTLCNRCGNTMFLNKENMRLAKPHCDDCTNRKAENVEKIRTIEEILKAMDNR